MNRFMIHIVAKDMGGVCHDFVFFGESLQEIKRKIYDAMFTEKDVEGIYEIRCLSGDDVSLPERIRG